jgi:spore coat protein A
MRALEPIPRRTFLKLTAAAGVAAVAAPRILAAPAKAADGIPTLDALSQPRFINALPNPLDPSFMFQPTTPGGSQYEIAIRQFEQELGLRDPLSGAPFLTTVWGYGTATQPATYPGRTIVTRRDTPITVHWVNDLLGADGSPLTHLLPIDTTIHWATHGRRSQYPASGVPIVTHLHGGHNRSERRPAGWLVHPFVTHDRAPDGPSVQRGSAYENDQEARRSGTTTTPSGSHGSMSTQAWPAYILRDENEDALEAAHQLPTGPYEIPVVIQDRMFDAFGQLLYPFEREETGEDPEPSVLPEFFGDFILVNGQAWPYLEVEPRQYRFRLLNGSVSRFYDLFLSSGQPFNQIGTDDGLLDAPVVLNRLTIGPGERQDVVLDFSDPGLWGNTIVLRNNARWPFPRAIPSTLERPARSWPSRSRSRSTRVSIHFHPRSPRTSARSTVRSCHYRRRRRPEAALFEGEDEFGRILPMLGTAEGGGLGWADPITENPASATPRSGVPPRPRTRPIHLHEVAFRLGPAEVPADRPQTACLTSGTSGSQRGGTNEFGWKDTVLMYPGEVTRIKARFDLAGEYVWHCHILSHEDHDMMRRYVIGPLP